MIALHEKDLSQQTFYRIPSKFKAVSPIRSYHPGVYDDAVFKPFNVLLVGSGESAYLKKHNVPVNDITELHTLFVDETFKETHGNPSEPPPVGFVKDTKGAREKLKMGNFKEEQPSYRVAPAPLQDSLLE